MNFARFIKLFFSVFIILITVYFLFLFFSNYDFVSHFHLIDYFCIFYSSCFLVFAYFVNAFRWKLLLLSGSKPYSFHDNNHNDNKDAYSNFDLKTLSLTSLFFMISMAASINHSFPGKIGEITKAYFIFRKYSISISRTASFIIIERLLDLCVVIFFLIFPVYFFSSNINLNFSENILSFLHFFKNDYLFSNSLTYIYDFDLGRLIRIPVLILAIIFVFIVILFIFKNYVDTVFIFLEKIFSFISADSIFFKKIKKILQNIYFLEYSFYTIYIIMLSILIWFCYSISIYFGFLAFGIYIEWYFVLAVMAIGSFGFLISVTPGSIGTYEFAFILASLIFIDKSVNPDLYLIVPCAFFIHALQVLVTWFVTLFGFILGKISFKDFRKQKFI